MTLCPNCGESGRGVSAVTVQAHTLAERRASLEALVGWRGCRSPSCDVGYFRDHGEPILLAEMASVPFLKSHSPDRLVCFCFEHTVAAVAEDMRTHGESTIKAAITKACGGGLDDCERKNPEGRCCLGNVAAVVRAVNNDDTPTQARPSGPPPGTPSAAPEPGADCCAPAAPILRAAQTKPKRAGVVAAVGAMGAAALSSACCWLPLVLLGLGASSASMGALFEAWRVPLLAITVGLVGLIFYLVYRRKPACAPGDPCEARSTGASRRNKVLLWLATVAVAAFAFFPEYMTVLNGDGISRQAHGAPAQTVVVYTVAGMTCGGCASHAKDALEKIEGVASASVSYAHRAATVVWNTKPDDTRVVAALAEPGYTARRRAER